MSKKQVIIIGAGGHAKVVADIVLKNNDILLGFLDDNKPIGTKVISNYEVIGNLNYINQTDKEVKYVIAIGSNKIRKEISKKYDLDYYIAIHPSSQIAVDVNIAEGTTIMANSVINPCSKIGKHVIVNTGVIIEHDNIVEDFVHISPNASLGGTVHIKELTHIGIGATIKNNITITNNVTIGAGTVVVKDITKEGTYIGVPARLK